MPPLIRTPALRSESISPSGRMRSDPESAVVTAMATSVTGESRFFRYLRGFVEVQDHFRRDSTTTQGVKARGFGVRRRIRTSSRECRGLKHNGNGMQDAGRGMIASHPDVADLSRRKVGRLAGAPRNPRECDEEAKAVPAPDRRCLCRPRHETESVGRDAPWRPEVLSRNGRPDRRDILPTRPPQPRHLRARATSSARAALAGCPCRARERALQGHPDTAAGEPF